MVVAVILSLLALRAALGKAQERLLEPIALAPQHDAPQLIGEVSEIARSLGVRAGMGLGEAIDICPTLGLVAPDPSRAEGLWRAFLARLEGIGAGVESTRSGEAFFRADEIERLYGGLDGVLAATAERLGPSVRLGAAPTRLAAFAAASRSAGRPEVVEADRLAGFLGSLPTTILIGRLGGPEPKTRQMVSSLMKLGIERLDSLTALSADAVSDRFGHLGIEARDAALGLEEEIRPRRPPEEVHESLDLPEDSSGSRLHGAMSMLCDRLAGRLADLGLSARKVTMEAGLVGEGSWARELAPRRPTASAEMLRLILRPGLEQLPRPARTLRLRVTELGPGEPEQIGIADEPEQTRARRLEEAAHQVRATVGEAGLMRVLDAELDSHLPERRMLLTPYLSEEP